jgi:beta-glucosidase
MTIELAAAWHRRRNRLIGEMTLAEKIGQMTMADAGRAITGPGGSTDVEAAIREGSVGSIFNQWGRSELRALQELAVNESRLRIPLIFGLDVLHGYRTIGPIPLGEACAFDDELWERTARAAAREAAAEGIDLTFAPMLDISRDPRWGRIAEGPGEDPHVASRFARAKVRGFQNDALADPTSVAAVVKHFAAYGAVTAGRDYASVDISERTLHEVYLPPFQAAVEAGAAAVMPGFNDLAGTPLTAHADLLSDVLRDRWAFEGVIVSDYGAIAELIAHGVARDLVEASALALRAGVNVDMASDAFARGLPEALRAGTVDLAAIDRAVGRILDLKWRLGLMDDPFLRLGNPSTDQPVSAIRTLVREAGRRSIVLLRNESHALPLPASVRKLALIGPLAHAPLEMLGPWWAAAPIDGIVSVLDGLRAARPDLDIIHLPGSDLEGDGCAGVAQAVAAAEASDAVLLCVGEPKTWSGEAASRTDIGLPEGQRALAQAVLATGRPVITVLFSGRPLAVPDLVERSRAVLAAWFPGSEAGHAVADILTGHHDATGRLAISWPRSVGQIPIFHAQRPTGRPFRPGEHYTSRYIDSPVEPLFPFGHGLSYAAFERSAPRADRQEVSPRDTLRIEVDITNRADRPGETVMFLFQSRRFAATARPVIELLAFRRAALDPGRTHTLVILVPGSAFFTVGRDGESVWEPGEIELHVGESASDPEGRSEGLRLRLSPDPHGPRSD